MYRYVTNVLTFFVFLSVTSAHAIDFRGEDYEVYLGDINGDGTDDIYLHVPDKFVFIFGAISIPLLIKSDAPSYLLNSFSNGDSFYLSPMVDETIDASNLSKLSSGVTRSDLNGDGVSDLRISSGSLLYDLALDGNSQNHISVVYSTAPTPGEITLEYEYDTIGRLTDVVDPKNGNRTYQYDDAGNRTSVTKE